MTLIQTDRLVVQEEDGRLVGWEVPRKTELSSEAKVFIAAIEGDARAAAHHAMEAIGFREMFGAGDQVAVKVNLGGGITGVPSSFTEPELVAGVLETLLEIGAKPFVCEADMRSFNIDEKMLRRRGYLAMLAELKVPFVNLSRQPTVKFYTKDLDIPLLLPKTLLDPAVKIISMPTPKHHWECGVTLSQKNMYGAIAERRKSIYHLKGQSVLERVIAGAARVMRPDLAVIGATQLCGGLGPHLCVPINFDRIVIGNDMIAADAVAAELLQFPYDRVGHAKINLGQGELNYKLLPGSAGLDKKTLLKIERYSIKPEKLPAWRQRILFSYRFPHAMQHRFFGKFEFIATWINKLFYAWRGDGRRRG